jgi:CBS domain-containing protein
MSVGAYCRKQVETARAEETVREAAQRMESTGVGCLVVVDERERPKGLLTDRDAVLSVIRHGLDADHTPVGEIMSGLTARAREVTPVDRAIRRMAADGVRRLPVVDAHGRLSGIFTYDDALMLIASNLSLVAEVVRAQLPTGAQLSGEEGSWEVPTARQYHQDPVWLTAGATLFEAVAEMEETGTGCIIVTDDERAPIGILTDRDVLCRALAKGADPGRTEVGDVMTRDAVYSRQDSSLKHVLEYARSRGVRRMPLVDDAGKLVAVVAIDDVMAELGSQLAFLSDAVRGETRRFHHAGLAPR